MSKILTVVTISAIRLAAGSLPAKLDADAASLCLASCDKDEAFDAFGRLEAYPNEALAKTGSRNAQKDFVATTCGSDPKTSIAALLQQAAQVIQELPGSRKVQRILTRNSLRRVHRLQSKIQRQTQAMLSTVADIKKRLATQTVKISGGLLPGAPSAASPTISMEQITERIVGITSTDFRFSKELIFGKIAEKELESVYSSVNALTKMCASSYFTKLLVIINMIKVDQTAMPLCHAKVLIALTLQSLEIEWETLKSEVNSASSVSFQQERKVYELFAQANMLKDIDLDKLFEVEKIAEEMMF